MQGSSFQIESGNLELSISLLLITYHILYTSISSPSKYHNKIESNTSSTVSWEMESFVFVLYLKEQLFWNVVPFEIYNNKKLKSCVCISFLHNIHRHSGKG